MRCPDWPKREDSDRLNGLVEVRHGAHSGQFLIRHATVAQGESLPVTPRWFPLMMAVRLRIASDPVNVAARRVAGGLRSNGCGEHQTEQNREEIFNRKRNPPRGEQRTRSRASATISAT
jgi:hypothetical protein